jgi:hypothetical protein
MFFEVLSPIYHSSITIDSLTYRVLLGTLSYSFKPIGAVQASIVVASTRYWPISDITPHSTVAALGLKPILS